MKSKILLMVLLLLAVSNIIYAQRALKAGNNPTTINSSAALEVESTTKGLLPPRMTNAQMTAIASPAQGLMVYCTDCSPVGLRVNDGTPSAPNWQSVGSSGASSATVVANCNTAGFNSGLYVSNTAFSGRNYSVTVTNNSFSTVIITFALSDLELKGLSNMGTLAVGSLTGSPNLTSNQATLSAGQSVTVTYQINGIPASCGTLTGVWTKLSLSCTKTVEVFPNINCSGGAWTAAVSPAPTSGLVNGTSYSGTYNIPYSGGDCNFAPESHTINGLNFSYSGGSIGASGNLTYNLSGTYSGTTGETVLFNTRRGCTSGACANQGILDSQDLDCDGIINSADQDDDNDGILDITEQGIGTSSADPMTGVTGTLLGSPNNFAVDNSYWDQHSMTSSNSYSERELLGMTFPQPAIVTSMTFNYTNNGYLAFGDVIRIEGSTNGTTWNDLTGNFSLASRGWNPTIGLSQNIGAYKFYRVYAVWVRGVDGGVLTHITFNTTTLVALDSDGDGILNGRDLDSDNDGCLDALEGSLMFTTSNISGNILSGGLNTFGVPLIATSNGQGIGNSRNAAVKTCTQ